MITNVDNTSFDLVVKDSIEGEGPSEYQLSKLTELTRLGLRKETNIGELNLRAGQASWIYSLLEKARVDKKFQLDAFLDWWLNTWQIGWCIREHLVAADPVELNISRRTFDDARQIAHLECEKLEELIRQMAKDHMRLTRAAVKLAVKRFLEPPEPGEGNGDGGKKKPEKKAEFEALAGFLDWLYQSQSYFKEARYIKEVGFQDRLKAPEMREAYVRGLKKLVQVISNWEK